MQRPGKHWKSRNGCYQFRLKIFEVYLNLVWLVHILCSLDIGELGLCQAWLKMCGASDISSRRHTKDSFGGLPFGRSCSKEPAHGRIPERRWDEQDMWDHWTTQHPVSWCKSPCQMGEVPFELTCCLALLASVELIWTDSCMILLIH